MRNVCKTVLFWSFALTSVPIAVQASELSDILWGAVNPAEYVVSRGEKYPVRCGMNGCRGRGGYDLERLSYYSCSGMISFRMGCGRGSLWKLLEPSFGEYIRDVDDQYVSWLSQVKTSFTFSHISRDARSFVITQYYRHPSFSKLLADRKASFRAAQKFALVSCDGKPIDSATVRVTDPIEDVIAGLREMENKRYFFCDMKAISDVELDTPVVDVLVPNYSETTFQVFDNDTISVRERVSFRDTNSEINRNVLLVRAKPLVAEDVRRAIEISTRALDDFVLVLKKYGEEIMIYFGTGATRAEKYALLKEYFEKNSGTIRQSLSDLETAMPNLPMNQRLGIHRTINEAYDRIHYLEQKIAEVYVFDEVIKSYRN